VTVRRAYPRDLKSILDYMQEQHAKSHLVHIKFDRASTAKMVNHTILAQDFCHFIAHDDKGEVVGLLIGMLEPYFFNQRKYYATDMLFISQGQGPQLWRAFRDWAFATVAVEIIMGISSGEERSGQLLEILGMEKTGGMYVLRR